MLKEEEKKKVLKEYIDEYKEKMNAKMAQLSCASGWGCIYAPANINCS